MTCQNCKEREGTEIWSEGSIAYVHGMYQRWCKVCVLSAQLEHAEKAVARIPELKKQLALELLALELAR